MTTATKVKRYALDLDMYVHAISDKEAKEFTKSIVEFLNQKFDSSARAKKLNEIPFGTLTPRNIEIHE